jgi:hypothetical protein
MESLIQTMKLPEPDPKKVAYVDSVLNANKHLNWVKRLYDPNSGSIQIPGEPGRSTHFMESGDGLVYPTVVQMQNGKLQYLGKDARDYALKTGEFIKFPTDEEAQWFANSHDNTSGYKMGTGVLGNITKNGKPIAIKSMMNTPNTPELWEKSIRDVEHKIGNPNKWTMQGYNELQNKLNEYKSWRENTPEGKAVIDYHNEPNEYIVPLPSHLKNVKTKKQ